MNSTTQMMKESHDGVDGKMNIVKGLPIIYKMSSTKQKMEKRNDYVDADANLLDSLVPDIDVPIMKPSESAWFKNWIQNAKCKMH